MGIRRQRWCCYWISSPIFPYSLFLLLLSLSFPPSFTLPINMNPDSYYDHCANRDPFHCGNITTDIKYPFWAPDSGRPEFCDHPGFFLTCQRSQDEDKLMISIGDDDHKRSYHVMEKIDYQDRVLHVIDADQLVDDATTTSSSSWPEKLSNTTLDFSLFSYLYGDGNYYKDINLTLFLNCKKVPNRSIDFLFPITGCYNDFLGQFSYFTWKSMVDGPSLIDLYDNCLSMVLRPVFAPDNKHVNYANFSNVLRVGFGLTWNVGKVWCDEECLKSGGICGSNITDVLKTPACFCPKGKWSKDNSCTNTSTHSTSIAPGSGGKKKKTGIIIGGVLGGLVAGIFMVCCLWWFCSRRKRQQRSSSTLLGRASPSDPSSMKDPEYGSTNYLTHIFHYQELEEATSNFAEANELGDGGFGTVYKGILRDGRTVAVKRLYENNYKRVEQFANEILILSRLRHTNLVILYGCTSRHSRELLLVYEFVPNGTVADHLHGPRAHEGSLTWPVRMSIAIETADALAYLHAVKPQIIHRDVKTNNILLDNNFHVKVADFGLSRLFPAHVTHVSTAPQGTPGYVDPEYHQCYQLTEKSDVYSFGVVLVELISSKPAVDITRHRHEINLANMAINKIQNSELDELIDPALGYETDYGVKRMITLVAELAFRCLQGDGDLRPTIREALEVLREIERGGSKAAEDDIPMRDDAGLLKSLTPDSPDTVMDKWSSKDTTPNTSK